MESNIRDVSEVPSEKAFAYKMRNEAMKRQAGRPTKDNKSPVGINLPKIINPQWGLIYQVSKRLKF